MIGQTIDSYRVEALLGEGGMGSVYRAIDVNLGRPVALKLMHPHMARQPEFRERFIQEARSAANLSHPSIVRIYQFEANSELMFIAMEYFPGGTLTGHLRRVQARKQVIDLRETLSILAQIADALDYAHRRGVIHRDIKPDNILMSHLDQPERPDEPPLRAVVTDFGLAKLRSGASVQTQDGTFMGTLAYMSPEQCLGKDLDGRTDLYALGVILYQMTTNRLPFDVKTPSDALLKHINEPVPPPRDISPNLPESVSAIILKCLEKDPDKRFATGTDLAAALRSAGAGLTTDQMTSYAPPAMAATLNTQIMPAQPEQRGPSVFGDNQPVASAPQDRLQVTTGKESTGRVLPVVGTSMVIGRDSDCDIALIDNRASRRHARLDFDGRQYTVTDLNSTNGSFLAGARLLPGIPESWQPDQVLQIGDSFLRILPARKTGGSPPPSGGARIAQSMEVNPAVIGGTAAYAGAQGVPSLANRAALNLEPTELSVQPGQAAAVTIHLFNQGSVVDHYDLRVEGIPAEWLVSPLPQVQLMPGVQQALELTIQPPRESQARAGSYRLTVKAVSQDNPNQVSSAALALTVKPFSQFTTEIFPQRVRAGRIARLTVKNTGNASQTFTVDCADRADEVIFEPRQAQLPIAEGQSAVMEFRAQPKQRVFVGSGRTDNISVRVTANGGEQQTQNGELISPALFPTWLIPILASLCVCVGLVGGGALLRGGGLLGLGVTPTATNQAIANATPPINANPTNLDSDSDGLSDEVEASLGTDPNNPDTDQDGIPDGLEVQQGTNPLAPNAPTSPSEMTQTAPVSETLAPTTVSNPLVLRLTQPNTGDYQPAENLLNFQVVTYDPQQGSQDGAGIKAVDFEFLDDKGALIYKNSESNPGYCAFQGGNPDCETLQFIRSNKQWPNGAPIFDGSYTMRATAIALDGRTAQIEYPFRIQLPPARLLYASDRTGSPDIFVRNLKDGNETNLTNQPDSSDTSPAWSPDGSQIAFETYRDGDQEVYVMTADGSGVVNLSNAPSSNEYDPAWSADGRYVAYSSDRLGDLDLFISDVQEGSTYQLTFDSASDFEPAFSPDGKYMAFLSDRGSGQTGLFMMEFAIENAKQGIEGKVTELYSSSDAASGPDWSPDSKTLVFSISSISDSDIYTLQPGGDPVQVTSTSFYESEPAWMPDGKQIIFTRTESYGALYIVNSNGGEARQFIPSSGYSNNTADPLP